MKIEEIRLTPGERAKNLSDGELEWVESTCRADNPNDITAQAKVRFINEYVANTATDKAIEKIIGLLEKRLGMENIYSDDGYHRVIGYRYILEGRHWQALKKMVKEEQYGRIRRETNQETHNKDAR